MATPLQIREISPSYGATCTNHTAPSRATRSLHAERSRNTNAHECHPAFIHPRVIHCESLSTKISTNMPKRSMEPAFTSSLALAPQPRTPPVTKRRPSRRWQCSATPPHSLSGVPPNHPTPRRDPARADELDEVPLDEVPLELVDGYLDNAKVRPKIDIDADEYMLMWKLRRMLHEDDFNKIFDQNSRRIGEF